jgi:hypothetical protein
MFVCIRQKLVGGDGEGGGLPGGNPVNSNFNTPHLPSGTLNRQFPTVCFKADSDFAVSPWCSMCWCKKVPLCRLAARNAEILEFRGFMQADFLLTNRFQICIFSYP